MWRSAGVRAAAIAAIVPSSMTPGSESIAPASPRASAPARMASCASSREAMQQILIRVRMGGILSRFYSR
jgi:hypothetical protein